MLLDAMGIIIADNKRINLGELINERALAAVPFAGRYRIIDMILSSMVNSGIKHIGILAETKYSSLMDHIGTGSYWDLDRLQQGLRIIPPYTQSDFFRSQNPQDLRGLYDFLQRSVQQYVVITESNLVANLDLSDCIKTHEKSDADITIVYNEDGKQSGSPIFSLVFDEENTLTDLLFDAENPPNNNSLGVCVMSRTLLVDILAQSIARGDTAFSVEFLLNQYKELKIKGFKCTNIVLRINSLATYFSSSMRLVDYEVRKCWFRSENKIDTKVKNEAPAKYFVGNSVSNSLISDGCDISGTVKDSIIFRGVNVGKHCKIQNCIIMQDTQIMDGAELSNVIIDKDTVIRAFVRLQGTAEHPVVIGKGVIV